MPGFVEPHVHLDKTLSLESGELENHSGTLSEAIERWNVSEPGRDRADFERRADDALRRALSRGVTALRTHVNVSSRNMLPLEALLAVRERWRGRIDVQLVALGLPGSIAEDAAYAEALRLGVDVIGGSPNHAPDPHAAIRSAFANWLNASGKPIDLHIDENEDRDLAVSGEHCRIHACGWAGGPGQRRSLLLAVVHGRGRSAPNHREGGSRAA